MSKKELQTLRVDKLDYHALQCLHNEVHVKVVVSIVGVTNIYVSSTMCLSYSVVRISLDCYVHVCSLLCVMQMHVLIPTMPCTSHFLRSTTCKW